MKVSRLVIAMCLIPLAWAGQDEKKGADKKKRAETPAPITVQFKIDFDGAEGLPSGSTIELKTEGEGPCKGVDRQRQLGSDGSVVFADVPVCKAVVTVSVTGFETKKTAIDLASYKDPIRIQIQ
jgi:hypothetical protein